MTWTKFYEENGVILGENQNVHGSYLVVADDLFAHYRITLSAYQDGRFYVGIGAEWSDDAPGELANYTPTYETAGSDCTADEIVIADDGLLTVLARQRSASHVDIRMGFTAKLPPAFVTPLRKAIEILRDRVVAEASR